MHVLDGADAAADGQGHETFVGRALDDVDHGGAAVGGGCDVEKDHFIGALFIVAEGQGDGVADVAQFASLGFAELHAAGDMAVMDVQTRDDTFCQHIDDRVKVAGCRKRKRRNGGLGQRDPSARRVTMVAPRPPKVALAKENRATSGRLERRA